MKVLISLLTAVLLIGCMDDSENARANMEKGEQFMKQGEFEVAEYYYERIPEDSPYYRKAMLRLEEIKKRHQAMIEQEASSAGSQEVLIARHSFQVDNMGKVPIHFITIENNSDQAIQMLELEFVYLGFNGKEVATLSQPLAVGIEPESVKEVKGVSPGIVSEPFQKVNIKINRILFK